MQERLHICPKCQRFLERRRVAEDYLTLLVSECRSIKIYPSQELDNSFSSNMRKLEKLGFITTTEAGMNYAAIKLNHIHRINDKTLLACRKYLMHYVIENN